VAGRNRTCGAPGFNRALYRAELRPRGFSGRGWNRTSDFLRVKQALWPAELLARVHEWAGLESNQPLFRIREALYLLSYPPKLNGSGTRARTSISTFRAWRPAG
jgi:hypothetical protein